MGRVGLEKQEWRDRLLLRLENRPVVSFLLESFTPSFLRQDPEQEGPGSSPEPAGLCCYLWKAEPCPAPASRGQFPGESATCQCICSLITLASFSICFLSSEISLFTQFISSVGSQFMS